MNKIKQIWYRITNIGVDETALGREIVKVRLLNQLIFFAFSVSVISAPVYFIVGDPTGIFWSSLSNVALEAVTVYQIYRQRHQLARFISIFVFPTFMTIHVILHGLAVSSIFVTTGVLSFILYEGKKNIQIGSIIYICLLFISSKIYVLKYFENNFRLDVYSELIEFPLVLVAIGSMLMLYQNELKKYEIHQGILINDLEYKNTALSQINEELERFTYIASHDLKTPLRTISSHLDLLKRHLDRNEMNSVMQDLQYAKTGTKQMYALVNDILEYKEINNRKESEAILDLNELVAEVMQQLEGNLKSNTVLVYNEGLPTIRGYKNELLVVFKNIIENGLKYNYALNPTINIFYKIRNKNIVIHFKDNGIGIEPEYHEKVFQFFKRLHRNEEFEGTGLGLGLCQKIIRNYNGQISLNSAKNKGSEFIVHLPLEILIL